MVLRVSSKGRQSFLMKIQLVIRTSSIGFERVVMRAPLRVHLH